MQLKHHDLWLAIDRLAEKHGYSPSGLALKSGLSSTTFNTSKRVTATRKRWPSTESIAHILEATDTSLDEFMALATDSGQLPRGNLPMLTIDAAKKENSFDEDGHLIGTNWEDIGFPALDDPHGFALEISDKTYEPFYREGDRLIVSPAEKPRRGDRIAARTKKGNIVLGHLGRENAHSVEWAAFEDPSSPFVLLKTDIDWLYRIIWVSQ